MQHVLKSAMLLFCSIAICTGLFGCHRKQQSDAAAEIASPRDRTSAPAPQETDYCPSRSTEEQRQFDRSEQTPSLIQVLVHPSYYDGKELQVEGYLVVRFEGTAIYISKDDEHYGITENGFWVAFKGNTLGLSEKEIAKEYNGKYVLLKGTFNQARHGHMGLFQGEFAKISRLLELGPRHLVRTPKAEEPKPGARDPFEP